MASMIPDTRQPELSPDWQPIVEVARRYKVSVAHVRRLALLRKLDWMRGTERVGGRLPVLVSCRSMERWAAKRQKEEYDPSCC